MKFTSIITSFVLALVLGVGAVALADDPDPIVGYYWQKARGAFSQFDPNVAKIRYQLTARTFWHSVLRNGRISSTDTVLQTLYFTGRALDSTVVIGDDENDHKPIDLSYASVFDMDLYPYLFPNDTGGIDLALGFLADSTQLDLPDGLAIIDRYRYNLRSLYLNYPHRKDFRRFSRCFRFVLVDDYLFPDSVWEVATELGVFFSESYRMETGITDIQIQRAVDSTDR